MVVTAKDVRYVAALARVRLTAEEEKRLDKDLAEIVSYIEKLNQVDTSRVEPTSHVLDIENIFRKDELKPSLRPNEVLRLAPRKADGFVVVPRVIEGRRGG